MANTDINVTPSVDTVLEQSGYSVSDWSSAKKGYCSEIEEVLSTASKSGTNKKGIPDRIFFSKEDKLLVLVEEKPNMKDHLIEDKTKGAISGIKWYLSRFLDDQLAAQKHDKLVGKFKNYKIVGIAVSGDMCKEYNHKFSCFKLDMKKQEIEEVPLITNFVKKGEFINLFSDVNIDILIQKISQTTKEINNLLRSIDSQKRPVLLSVLMICLHKNAKISNNFNEIYDNLTPSNLAKNIISVSEDVLKQSGIPEEKIKILKREIAFLDTDPSLTDPDSLILKQILRKVEADIIPLFNNPDFIRSNYDIIGKFYEEFLKYAGITNVKKGIVLTPRHITTLFTKLIDLKYNDKIVDLCCGTGAFLIASMNAIINQIGNSELANKEELINCVKQHQLLGFENNPTMYTCAVSNMMFRGDGKSSIYCCNSISKEADIILKEFKPTIGFINPPYSGKENAKDPTPKEITFLCKMLDNCSRYGIMIAPLSVYNKEADIRNKILSKHTLKAVINMPGELFQPNAGVHTAISIFETNRPFNYEKDTVVFYDLQDDGFILNKSQGRVDYYNKWKNIENSLLDIIRDGKGDPDNIKYVKTNIKQGDEWTIYAFSETDYSTLSKKEFIKTISDYAIFKAKRDMGLLNLQEEEEDKLNEFELLSALGDYYGVDKLNIKYQNDEVNTKDWRRFKIVDYFKVPSIKGDLKEKDCLDGNIPLVSASKYNSGIVKYIDENGDGKAEIFTANAITADMFCNVFFQDKNFFSVSHGRVNVLKPNFSMNQYVAMFIVTLLKHERYKYPYGRNLYMEEIKNTKIKLPAKVKMNELGEVVKDENGHEQYEPDWAWMEEYIKSLPYSDLI